MRPPIKSALARTFRVLAGWLCILGSFALVVLLGFGALDPGGPAPAGAESATPALIGLLPSVSVGIALFALGVWLVAGAKSTGTKSK